MLQEMLPAWRLTLIPSVSFYFIFICRLSSSSSPTPFVVSFFVFPVEVNARFSKDDMIYSIRIVIDDHEVQHFAFRSEAAVAARLVFAAAP